MSRDSSPLPPGRRGSAPSARDAGGVSAALQLLPLPTFMVDETGVVLACNESFAEQAGVPHTLLVGREWWQAFAERSAPEARATQRSIIEGNEARGTALIAMTQADGGISQLSLAWHRLTEPATRR